MDAMASPKSAVSGDLDATYVATEDEATDVEEDAVEVSIEAAVDGETDVESEAGAVDEGHESETQQTKSEPAEQTVELPPAQDVKEEDASQVEVEVEDEVEDDKKKKENPVATTNKANGKGAKKTDKKKQKKKKGPAQHGLTPAQQQTLKQVTENTSIPVEKRLRSLREAHAEALMQQNGLKTYTSLLENRLELSESELAKTIKLKDRYEALCRELQARNKDIIAKSESANAKQEELRKQSNADFQSALDSLSKKIESNGEMEKINGQLHKALEDASARLKLVEEHHARQLEAKSIELQLSEAKAKQQQQITEGRLKEFQLRAQLQETLLEENKSLKASLESSQSMFGKLHSTVGETDKALKSMRQEMKGLLQNKAKITEENKQLRDRYLTLQETHKTETKRLTAQASKQSAQLDKLKALARSLKEQLDARDQNQAAN
ncbi:Gamma-taxilin [Hondaea fermentalgiana]|uniref:Gamma-taxilin n=1 Tax=Hondaea fermentalgiana TaxID=2315210 RepID=A0A2R5FZE8_9STRA|nr:Gamma-taxilin [Hondaea fermentalgiana]|eukprot:GBG24100.1 Gamma-taxilin [Hondaea fermentalgiana]